jgi:hypothetical protein
LEKLRTENVLPRRTASKTEKFAPERIHERTLKLEPRLDKFTTESVHTEPEITCPRREQEDPHLMKLLTDKLEPHETNERNENALPHLTALLKLMDEPK